MSIDKLPTHYAMVGPVTAYDEEAVTALQLAGRLGGKVNECVDVVNAAKEYMMGQLDKSVDALLAQMVKDGTIHNAAVKAVADRKVDKGGLEQVTWNMLAQNVKTAMTGGSVAVVGENAVNTSNIVNRAVTPAKVSNAVMPPHITMHRYFGQPDAVVFNVDTAAHKATVVNGGTYYIYMGCRSVKLDFDAVAFDLSNVEQGFTRCYVYYNPNGARIVFQSGDSDVPSDYVFLGILVTNDVQNSTMVVPFSVNGKYLYNPQGVNRAEGHILYYPIHYYSKTLPYVDYRNKRIVFPSVNYLYLVCGDRFYNLSPTSAPDNYVDGDFVVPFGESYQFIVGGSTGIKAVDNNTFSSMKETINKDGCIYLGCLHAGAHHAELNFEFVDGAGSLSILGDSISAMEGEIPAGNAHYYSVTGTSNSKEQMWWNMVMRRCGLYKNTVQAWSGRCVTDLDVNIPTGVRVADQLDNGEDPDNIIVYLGTNDFRRGFPLGDYDCKGPIPVIGDTFRAAYAIMLHRILTRYPGAKVYACTLPASERNSEEVGLPEKNTAGVYLFEYNEAIREIARRLNVEVIELETCAINYANGSRYMADYGGSYEGSFTHPKTLGHKAIANKVIQSVIHGRNYNND